MKIPGLPSLQPRKDPIVPTRTRVIIVEDDPVVVSVLSDMLFRLGYTVAAVATSGEQALAHIGQSPADIVLMDVQIPGGIDGIETAHRIPADLHLPVIYLTAHCDDETISRASTTRPCGFLIKPIQERLLHANIVAALANSFKGQSIWTTLQAGPAH